MEPDAFNINVINKLSGTPKQLCSESFFVFFPQMEEIASFHSSLEQTVIPCIIWRENWREREKQRETVGRELWKTDHSFIHNTMVPKIMCIRNPICVSVYRRACQRECVCVCCVSVFMTHCTWSVTPGCLSLSLRLLIYSKRHPFTNTRTHTYAHVHTLQVCVTQASQIAIFLATSA